MTRKYGFYIRVYYLCFSVSLRQVIDCTTMFRLLEETLVCHPSDQVVTGVGSESSVRPSFNEGLNMVGTTPIEPRTSFRPSHGKDPYTVVRRLVDLFSQNSSASQES